MFEDAVGAPGVEALAVLAPRLLVRHPHVRAGRPFEDAPAEVLIGGAITALPGAAGKLANDGVRLGLIALELLNLKTQTTDEQMPEVVVKEHTFAVRRAPRRLHRTRASPGSTHSER